MTILLLLLTLLPSFVYTCSDKIILGRLNSTCTASSSTSHKFSCSLGIDGNINTLWTPDFVTRDQNFFTININPNINLKIKRVDLLQYSWIHGKARSLRLILHQPDGRKYSEKYTLSESSNVWDKFLLFKTFPIKKLTLMFLKYTGESFGGIKEVVVIGCYSIKKKQSQFINDSNTEGSGKSFLIYTVLFLLLLILLTTFIFGVYKARKYLQDKDRQQTFASPVESIAESNSSARSICKSKINISNL